MIPAVLLSFLLLGAIFASIIAGPVIAPWNLAKIRPGMTIEEVEAVLGSPEHRDSNPWIYERWGTIGWVEVHFDVDHRVQSVNDESAIPIR